MRRRSHAAAEAADRARACDTGGGAVPTPTSDGEQEVEPIWQQQATPRARLPAAAPAAAQDAAGGNGSGSGTAGASSSGGTSGASQSSSQPPPRRGARSPACVRPARALCWPKACTSLHVSTANQAAWRRQPPTPPLTHLPHRLLSTPPPKHHPGHRGHRKEPHEYKRNPEIHRRYYRCARKTAPSVPHACCKGSVNASLRPAYTLKPSQPHLKTTAATRRRTTRRSPRSWRQSWRSSRRCWLRTPR